jgi:hypothetical protein
MLVQGICYFEPTSGKFKHKPVWTQYKYRNLILLYADLLQRSVIRETLFFVEFTVTDDDLSDPSDLQVLLPATLPG